jgi:hypothetical protein
MKKRYLRKNFECCSNTSLEIIDVTLDVIKFTPSIALLFVPTWSMLCSVIALIIGLDLLGHSMKKEIYTRKGKEEYLGGIQNYLVIEKDTVSEAQLVVDVAEEVKKD